MIATKRSSRFSIKRESVKVQGAEGREHLPYADREDTPLEKAVDGAWADTKRFVQRLSPDDHDSLLFEAEMTGFAFCGHVMADLDSIAGAIGAAVSFMRCYLMQFVLMCETRTEVKRQSFSQNFLLMPSFSTASVRRNTSPGIRHQFRNQVCAGLLEGAMSRDHRVTHRTGSCQKGMPRRFPAAIANESCHQHGEHCRNHRPPCHPRQCDRY